MPAIKLLTICIPTYKRPTTLLRCINSAAEQIKRFGLEEKVEIYVANDASPDNTADVLDEFRSMKCLRRVDRGSNLGMSANIKCMLEETMMQSTYQLIITDDDYLQPGVLKSTIEFLTTQFVANPNVSLIWTPRYSYTEDGEFHGVVCNPFSEDMLIPPSLINAGRYMNNGFVLSGLIVNAGSIDFTLWNEHLENAYFPVIFSGNLISKKPSLYWNINLVHHTVLNKCHWERWGKSDAEITLRLFIDFVNTFVVIGKRIESSLQTPLFYASTFPSVSKQINNLLISFDEFRRLSTGDSTTLLSTDRVSFAKVMLPARIIFYIVIIKTMTICSINAAIYGIYSSISIDQSKKVGRWGSHLGYRRRLSNAAFAVRWAW